MPHQRMSILQVSDLHVDPGLPADLSVLQRAEDQIKALRPDLVVVTGDVSQDGYKHPEMFGVIRDAMRKWPAPVQVIPGNHDIGDRFMSSDPKVDHLAQWNAAFGSDRFAVQHDGWRIVGVDSEIIGVGFAEEEQQHRWFVEQLDEAQRAGQFVAVFMHGPPYLRQPGEHFTDHSSYWAIKPQARGRVLEQLERPHVRLLANGHMHWYHATQHRGLPWYWCPSAKAAVDDARFPGDGELVGLMHYELGDGAVTARLIRFDVPPGTYYFGRPKITAPGREQPIELAHLVVPLHGALSHNGSLPEAVAAKLKQVAELVRVTVLADAVDEARKALGDLPVLVRDARQAEQVLASMGRHRVVAIGQAVADRALLERAAIGLSIGGPCAAAVRVQVGDVLNALDLLTEPGRLQGKLVTR